MEFWFNSCRCASLATCKDVQVAKYRLVDITASRSATDRCAARELEEETGLSPDLVTVEAETSDWVLYDLPQHLVGKLWKGRFRGLVHELKARTRWKRIQL